MSITFTCDLCGQAIGESDQYVTVSVEDSRTPERPLRKSKRRWEGGWAGHYHSAEYGDKQCYEQLDDLLELVRARARGIGAIPVAKPWEIEEMRTRHRNPTRDAAIEDLASADLSPRSRNALMRAGITLAHAQTMSDGELLSVNGVGWVALQKLRQAAKHPEAK